VQAFLTDLGAELGKLTSAVPILTQIASNAQEATV